MDNYGFVITKSGWELLSQITAGNNKLIIDGVLFGNGNASDNIYTDNLALFTELVNPIAEGTFTEPQIETTEDGNGTVLQKTISFICEYRSDYDGTDAYGNVNTHFRPGDVFPSEIYYDFYIKEFGIYAHLDKYDGSGNYLGNTLPVMIYYGCLETTPHPVTTYAKGAVDVRRYPVSIVLAADAKVELSPLPLAFVTHQEMEDYYHDVIRPEIYEEDTKPYVDDEHNENYPDDDNKEAHPDIRAAILNNTFDINRLWDLLGDGATSYIEKFDSTTESDSKKATSSRKHLYYGIFNKNDARLEF